MKIPKSWNDVTIGQFMELRQSTKDIDDNFDITNTHIAVLCGITQQDVLAMKVETRNKIVDRISFITTEPTGEFKPTFWHNRKRWKVTDNINKLTASQYVDVSMFIKLGAAENYHNILAVICRPMRLGVLKRTYDTDKVINYADELLSLPVPVAMSIAAFFLNSLQLSIDNTPTYLEEIQKTLMKEALSIDLVGT